MSYWNVKYGKELTKMFATSTSNINDKKFLLAFMYYVSLKYASCCMSKRTLPLVLSFITLKVVGNKLHICCN